MKNKLFLLNFARAKVIGIGISVRRRPDNSSGLIACLQKSLLLMQTSIALGVVLIAQMNSLAAEVPQEQISASQELSRQEKVKKAKQFYLAGQEFYQQGDYQAADRAFKQAQQILEGFSLPVVKETVSFTQQKSSINLQSLLSQAWDFSQKGQSEQAISYYLKAVRIDSKNVNLYYNLAVEYIKTNEFNLAVEALERVVGLNPEDKDAWYNLGVLFEVCLGDQRQAVEYYCRYVKLAAQAEDVNQVKEWIAQINSSQ